MPTDPEPQPPPTLDDPPPPSTAGVPFHHPSLSPGIADTLHQALNTPMPEADPSSDPQPGQRIGDFYLIELLGAGSFAQVFLAMQVSLGRQVALKVARTMDSEAQTLAGLEHEYIVPVFSESVDPQRHLRLLCMKFVPGTTLETVLRDLSRRPYSEWSGLAILEAIEKAHRHETILDLAAARDRDVLAHMDFFEAVCWLGSRVAEALAHAHGRGILHRDIKPANILMNYYGRPLLSDFNLAQSIQRGPGESFGGTLRYMSPEHLRAFQGERGSSQELVDVRSDIYSLGVVLYELLTAQPIFGNHLAGRLTLGTISQLEQERSSGIPSPRSVRSNIPEVLDRVIRRCLDPDPSNRYQNAEDLVQALEGCRQMQRWEREFPPLKQLTKWCDHFPVPALLVITFLPHIAAAVVNIIYNTKAIVSTLTPEQQHVFNLIMLASNSTIFPICCWLICLVLIPLARMRKRLAGPERVTEEDVTRQRHRALILPMFSTWVAFAGWLPAGLIFPLSLHLFAGPIDRAVFIHFGISFTISGLIAISYTYFGLQMMVLRAFYPRLWIDPRWPREQARLELEKIEGRLLLFQVLAGLIPLSGASLMVFVSGAEMLTLSFRLLIVGLMGLGMVGFGIALMASSRISQTLEVMLGSDRRSGPRRASSSWSSASRRNPPPH